MREFPYPASDDPLLVATFGAEVGGMIVLCSAGGRTADGQWNVAIALGGEGMLALECVRRADGHTTTGSTTLTSQQDWTAVFERVTTGSLDADFFDISAWMSAEKAMADLDPAWDQDEAQEGWKRAIAHVKQRTAVTEARMLRRKDMTVDELIEEIAREDSSDPAEVRTREIQRAMDEFAAMSPPGRRPN